MCLASGDGAAVSSGCWWHTLRGLNQVFVSARYQLPDHLRLRLGQDAYGVHVPAKVARDHASVTSWGRQSWYCNAAWLHAAAVSGCSGEASCQRPCHQHVGCCGDSGRPLLPW